MRSYDRRAPPWFSASVGAPGGRVESGGLHLYGRLRGFAARKRESLALANRFYRETYLQP